jgi:hypothetical protein
MWSWGVHVFALDVVPAYVRLTCLNRNTWEQVWDMVDRVDRPNFGINLDTFQILGATLRHHISTRYLRPIPARAWADIVSPSSSDRTLRDADQVLHTSLTKLTSTLSDPKAREKIVYLQISDGSKHVKAEDLIKSAAEVRVYSTRRFSVRVPELSRSCFAIRHQMRPRESRASILCTSGQMNGVRSPLRALIVRTERPIMADTSRLWTFARLF